MDNQNHKIRLLLEEILKRRVSDSYWYKVKQWLDKNARLSPEGLEQYLNRYSPTSHQIGDTTKWLEAAPDKIKFTDFIKVVERVYQVKWGKKPGRTTIYHWFNTSDLGSRFTDIKAAKHFVYTKTELLPVVSKVLNSRLVQDYTRTYK